MKTAISIPDAAGERAKRAAKLAGMNFSEFMTKAAEEYAQKLEAASTTEAINAALHAIGDDDTSAVAVRAGRDTLSRSEW
jgi:hypothetical protein